MVRRSIPKPCQPCQQRPGVVALSKYTWELPSQYWQQLFRFVKCHLKWAIPKWNAFSLHLSFDLLGQRHFPEGVQSIGEIGKVGWQEIFICLCATPLSLKTALQRIVSETLFRYSHYSFYYPPPCAHALWVQQNLPCVTGICAGGGIVQHPLPVNNKSSNY
jgi:hypothetical protein